MEEIKKPKFRSLSVKVLLWIIFTSSVFTTFFTCFSLYLDYRNEVRLIDLTIEQVRKSTVSSLGRSLWDINLEQVQAQVEGIMKINDVTKVEVFDEKGERIISKKKASQSDYTFETSFNLTHITSEGEKNLGRLVIRLTQENMYDRLKTKIIYIFLTQGLKTLLISFIIVLIINKFILRYLMNLSMFFKNYDVRSIQETSIPVRENGGDDYDELDTLYESMQVMQKVIVEQNLELKADIQKKDVEIEKQKVYAENASRLASLGEMAGGIAHEINNPLMIISSSSDMIRRSLNSDDPDVEKIGNMNEKIKKTVKRVVDIIQGLKRIARNAEHDELTDVSVSTIIASVKALCFEKFQSDGVKLEVQASESILSAKVKCREVQISQVLINLLNNANKAVKPLKDPWIKIQIEDRGDEVEFAVMDSGSGISEEMIAKIFEPFFTTRVEGEGTGLGLSISKSIVEQHGSQLHLDAGCENTRFFFRLLRDRS